MVTHWPALMALASRLGRWLRINVVQTSERQIIGNNVAAAAHFLFLYIGLDLQQVVA